MVCCDAERFQIRRKVAPTVFVSLDSREAVAAGFANPREDGRQRESRTNVRDAGGAAKNFSAWDRNLSQRWKNGCVASAAFAGFFAAETRTERARTADRDAEWLRAGD